MITRALDIPGWMSHCELEWLASKARESPVIIEFGCYLGRSTRALADNTTGIVYAVDPWNGVYFNNDGTVADWINTGVYEIFESNLKDHLETGRVIPIRSYSWSFVDPIRADLIFIDGDHRYEEVKNDIIHALTLIKSGGIISGHDYSHKTWPGVKRAVDELFGDVNHCDSIWWTEIG
jgi:hypothetical protein